MPVDYDSLRGDNNTINCSYLEANYDPEFFGLLYFNYCKWDADIQYITWPLIVIIVLLCFYFLSTSVDEYVSKILGRMSVKLKMSQNLAGLTLLAFGNQAVDIMVALVTGDDDNGGFISSLSTILGADSLVIGLVLPTVIFLGNGVTVKGQNFIRDLLTYLCAILFVFSLGAFYGYLNIMLALIIFGLYIVYVGICIIMERVEKKRLIEKKGKNELDENDDSIEHDDHHDFKVELFKDDEENTNEKDDDKSGNELIKNNENKSNKSNKSNKRNNKKDTKETIEKKEDEDIKVDSINNENILVENELEKQEKKNKKKKKHKKNKNDEKEIIEDQKDDDDSINPSIPEKLKLIEEMASLGDIPIFNINEFINDKYYLKKSNESVKIHRTTSVLITDKNIAYNRLHYTLAKFFLHRKEEKWSEISFFKCVFKVIIEIPINLIRNLTTPPFEKEKWKKEYFAIMPITISLIISVFFNLFKYYTKYPSFIAIGIYYFLGIILCIVLYHKTYKGSLPNCEWVLLISSAIMSLLWIYVITNILIQMVMDAQLLLPFKVPKSFLIMTVLAIGNALPDFLIDCTLSRSGYAEMALSGTIGSPVFSLLFGFGLSLIKYFIGKQGNIKFDLINYDKTNNSNRLILCAMGGVFINLVHYMIVFSLSNFKVKRYVSYAGYFVFLLYLTSLVLFSFVFNKV